MNSQAGSGAENRTASNQVSCGGVVFKESESEILVCLVCRKRGEEGVWCLPKGHMEQGETFEETALREVREETGLLGSIVAPIRKISYSFYDSKTQKQIFKTVHFFLIRYVTGKFDDHDEEVECAQWFSVEEALRRDVYEGERDVLKNAGLLIKDFGG